MGTKVTITIEGLDKALSRLDEIEKKGQENLVKQTAELAKDTKTAWKQFTPKGKTGRLSGGDEVEPQGMSFTLRNSVYYYKFVDEGHRVLRGWRVKRGVKGFVKGQDITPKTTKFVEQNIERYLAKFLDNV